MSTTGSAHPLEEDVEADVRFPHDPVAPQPGEKKLSDWAARCARRAATNAALEEAHRARAARRAELDAEASKACDQAEKDKCRDAIRSLDAKLAIHAQQSQLEGRRLNPLVAGLLPGPPSTQYEMLLQKAELIQKVRGICPRLLQEIDDRRDWKNNWFWWLGDPPISEFFGGALRGGYPAVKIAHILVERLWPHCSVWDELVEDRDAMEFVFSFSHCAMEDLLRSSLARKAYRERNLQVLNSFHRMAVQALAAMDKKKRRPRRPRQEQQAS